MTDQFEPCELCGKHRGWDQHPCSMLCSSCKRRYYEFQHRGKPVAGELKAWPENQAKENFRYLVLFGFGTDAQWVVARWEFYRLDDYVSPNGWWWTRGRVKVEGVTHFAEMGPL